MRRSLLISAGVLSATAIALLLLLLVPPAEPPGKERFGDPPQEEETGPGGRPSLKSAACEKPDDWFFRQRAFPLGRIPAAARERGFAQALALQSAHRDGATWVASGPSNIGGRVTALAIHPQQPNVIYAGAADGGVLKSSNGGTTWAAVTDGFPSLSIGALAVDPTAPDVIYAGTGEANAAGDTYAGNGVYVTRDGGLSWEWLGLPDSYKIGRIVIDPLDPARLYVAVLGALYSTNPERGIYRSDDGGATWERSLFVNDSTGAVDVVIDPTNPQRLYAATWERIRRPNERRVGGPGSGLYRSLDGGDSWTRLDNGLPPAAPDVGRIGLTLCASAPHVLYAIYADDPGYFLGVYKSTDGGDSWTQVNDGALSGLYSSFGWYFGNIRVAPSNPDSVFVLGVPLYRSVDGGSSWQNVSGSTHVDHHALYIFPGDAERVVDGNDGGVYTSLDGGGSWEKHYNLPISQFYAITVDALAPERLYGGTQDNGTLRTLTGALNDWEMILGGDGFYVNVDYADNDIIYAESQWGWLYKSTNGGSSFYGATNGIAGGDRRNWSTPVVMDPLDSQTLYYGTYRLYRTTNGAGSWSPISDDLTGGAGGGSLTYGTITTVSVSPVDTDLLWVGTDDGRVWKTPNGGAHWFRVDDPLPERWVTRVAADPLDDYVAYVTLSGYREDSFLPHVFRTANGGATWSDISANLPEIPVNDIVIDPAQPAHLFVATDAGVYASFDTGGAWFALGGALPNSAVHDLHLDPTTRTLIAGTHGRSMFRLDLESLAGIEEPPQPRAPRAPLAVAPNPLRAGQAATITWRAGGGLEGTTAGALAAGALDAAEISAMAELLVLDAQGRLVRRLLPASATGSGTVQFAWDGRSVAGSALPAGIYLLRLEAGATVAAGRISLLP